MKHINLGALLALADSTTVDEIKKEFKLDLMPTGIKEAVIAIKAERAKAATYAAANEVVALIEAAEEIKLQHVLDIRKARQSIERSKRALDDIATSEKYANETSNYLPLYAALGLPTHILRGEDVLKQSLFVIPVKHKQITIVKRPAKA